MTDRSTRVMLWLMSVFLCIAAVAVVVLPWSAQMESSSIAPRVSSGWIKPRSASLPEPNLSEQDFKYVWEKTLRRRFSEPKAIVHSTIEPVLEPKPVIPAVPLDAELNATLVDADPKFARAWMTHHGKQQKMKVGDHFEDHPSRPTLTAIRHREVDIELSGERRTIALESGLLFVDLGSPTGGEASSVD